MSLLDKLKPQPRWKNADPVIRLEALRDLDDPVELEVLAESDPDVRIRRAAVVRVSSPDVLGQVSASDSDPETRDRAADRLLAIASAKGDGGLVQPDHESGTTPADRAGINGVNAPAIAAVRALSDPRRLSTLAKSDAAGAVRIEALARITDERALGGIARHAKHESTAAFALTRIAAGTELLEVALHSDHRDVACRAFDRLITPTPDLVLLRSIEARAQQKAVSKRARTMILQIENAEAAERAALEERQRRDVVLCEAIEQVAAITDVQVARAEVVRLAESWQGHASSDSAALDRFAVGVRAAEEAILGREREAEEEADRRRLRAEAIATRDALCARVETLDGDDVLEQLVPIEDEWRSLLPLVGNGVQSDRLAERFSQAVAACRRRHALREGLAANAAALAALVEEAETLVAGEITEAGVARWSGMGREVRRLLALFAEAGRPAEDPGQRVAVVEARFAAREAGQRAETEKARQNVLAQIQRLIDRAKRVAAADAISLREGERLLRDIGTALEAAAAESGRDVEGAAGQLRALQEQVAPRVRECREMDEWRRFANAQRQEQLIAMAEAIVTSLKADEDAGRSADLAATARALRELHAKWHEVAEAPRQMAQRLWDRFRTATDFIRSRCEVFFAKVREERRVAVETKTAIVTEAEALATSTDWAQAAARFQQLQTEWQEGAPVAQDISRELAHRFRTASNAFFARRREDMTDRKKIWSENLAKKEALCQRVEELSTSTDWDPAAAEIKRMQAEWKTIGPVRRNKSDVVWNRFRAAADRFFESYHHRHEIALAGKLAEREAFVVELEGLANSEAVDWPADMGERVQQLRTTWNRAIPVPAPGMKVLADRWQAALSKMVSLKPEAFAGTDLDPTAVTRKMQKLVERVESFLADLGTSAKGLSQTELLAARLRSAFASNAMGGGANNSEELKWRAAADAVRDAQAAWQRLPPTTGSEARGLENRFRDACRRVTDHTRRMSGGQPRRMAGQTAVAG